MVSTGSSNEPSSQPVTNYPSEPSNSKIVQQLTFITSRLEALDAAVKVQTSGTQTDVNLVTSFKGKGPKYNRAPRNPRKSSRDEDVDIDVDTPWWLNNPSHGPHTKMEFPRFKGGDPRGWILKAEKYFLYYQTHDDLKVDIASMYLDGDPLDLFAWINKHCLLGVFLTGLKEELKVDVRIHKPRTVYKAMSLAVDFEQKMGSNCGNKGSQWPNMSRSNTSKIGSARDALDQSVGNQLVSRTNPNSVQISSCPSQNRAWDIEKQNCIAKGLCFICNEKFLPGNRCKTTSLTLMETNDNIEGGELVEQMPSDIIDRDASTNDLAEISFHAFLGDMKGTTMKPQGTLNGCEVIPLANSGSSHNFISDKIVQELQLLVHIVPYFGVQIGNGEIIRCNRLCQNLVVKFPGLTIDQHFYPFSVGEVNLVLGIC
ncbi:hypothetical protein FXO38_12339 [Capsicum annuum]|nr:hypothetical protein FXO38_12339 [Capsicum annuum]KAF3662618.1 hypothetical protein FXO37_12362 [Capsicum annuum]